MILADPMSQEILIVSLIVAALIGLGMVLGVVLAADRRRSVDTLEILMTGGGLQRVWHGFIVIVIMGMVVLASMGALAILAALIGAGP